MLDFTGANTTTSGRETAPAIGPNCQTDRCCLSVAAANGGIWRTANALADSPKWTFISGMFGTNAIGALMYEFIHEVLYVGIGGRMPRSPLNPGEVSTLPMTAVTTLNQFMAQTLGRELGTTAVLHT